MCPFLESSWQGVISALCQRFKNVLCSCNWGKEILTGSMSGLSCFAQPSSCLPYKPCICIPAGIAEGWAAAHGKIHPLGFSYLSVWKGWWAWSGASGSPESLRLWEKLSCFYSKWIWPRRRKHRAPLLACCIGSPFSEEAYSKLSVNIYCSSKKWRNVEGGGNLISDPRSHLWFGGNGGSFTTHVYSFSFPSYRT